MLRLNILLVVVVASLCIFPACTYQDPYGGSWEVDKDVLEGLLGTGGCYDALEKLAERNLRALREANQEGDQAKADLAMANLDNIDAQKAAYEEGIPGPARRRGS